ncbi:Fe(3+) ABC transporter substrate-binding protein [Steroidobacter sp.]|uniref:Fe(3+) ABC transporter substrate-binding protein n=1 Tax=Steroidobacter sp. TaxID=1978227 RepID=UPI001A4CF74E|nr:Fe(3+) ABC transporter substrate-binding protein [Steroidobacter sp.]MBL8265755.1 Fe(3+) ABC transporter substrate-binding protein [Steroidobacter sp.]
MKARFGGFVPTMGAVVVALGLLVGVTGCANKESSELVVYSARIEALIKPIFDRYTAETGQKIRFVTDDAGPLIERLNAEGANSQADILLTVDAGELWHAADRGLLKPIQSDVLNANIPESLRDPQGRWFGFSIRARTIVYSTERVKPEDLSDYAALAEPRWKGKLCLRTSKKVYNQSLVAMLIAEHGEPKTEEIVRGWVANLAAEPFSNDTLLMEAIAAGQCDVGLVNTYYFGRLVRDQPDLPIKLFWADQAGQGVHINISGAGVTAHSPRAEAAQKFLEWLSQPEAQQFFAGQNLEYAASPSIEPDPIVKAWGDFKRSPMNVVQAGELQAQAVKLMDRVGYR